jgi:hypothetical protein
MKPHLSNPKVRAEIRQRNAKVERERRRELRLTEKVARRLARELEEAEHGAVLFA